MSRRSSPPDLRGIASRPGYDPGIARAPLRLAIVTAVLLSACASAAASEPAAIHVVGGRPIIAEPLASTVATLPEPTIPLLPGGVDVVAIPRNRLTPMWEAPGRGQPDFLFDGRNGLRQLAPVLVAGARRAAGDVWYQVYLPVRPNGRKAWLRADDVKLRERDQRIEVDLSERTLRYLIDGRVVDRISVGVGTPATPTATGIFYVWVKVRYPQPDPAYGILALGLSGHSEVLTDWPGGGRLAVHGTANPADRGRAVSHGCVRVYNGDLEALMHVPMGTPVIITR